LSLSKPRHVNNMFYSATVLFVSNPI
jgi:hypothetical protein